MTLRLTTVDDLLAGWSWEAYPTVEGYRYIVKDPEGEEWGADFYASLSNPEKLGRYLRLRDGLALSNEKSWEEYRERHRFELQTTNNKKVRKYGEKCVRACIESYLKYQVHPKQRPTIGVTYVGSQR
jgi:hypothetical protein